MSHAASRGRGLACDESDHWLPDVFLDVFRGGLFGAAADLADHDDGVGIGILVEQPDGVNEGGADDGVAADADAGRLSDPQAGELAYGFVSQRARAGDNAHMAGLVNVRRHDADLAFAG